MTFEDFLQLQFMKECPQVSKDDFEDEYDRWQNNLGDWEWIEHGNTYGALMVEHFKNPPKDVF